MAQRSASPRPWSTRLLSLAVVVGFVLLLLRAPLPGYVLRPGPVFPLADQVRVEGAAPLNGDYLFTTIRLDAATMASALATAFDPEAQVVSRRALLGDLDEEAFVAHQEDLFDQAEALAIMLALDLTDSDVPASAVTISGEGVGGPSAGLMITLAVADLASPQDLADGRLIAGTGAVDEEGRVIDVSSVADKVTAADEAGADVFLVPPGLLDAAQATGTDMVLLPVATVDEALTALAEG
ncbi:MAG TPA: S16 family serine protease [Euzebya sp.]|nr:S16 family serine protease [Euzebya sp.]